MHSSTPKSRHRIPRVSLDAVRGRRGACVHAGRSIAQADLFEIEWEGRTGLLKDFSNRPWIVRRWLARPIIAREVRALARLQRLDGVPRLWARVGREAYVMERLDAVRLPLPKEPPPSAEFWLRARVLLDAMHAAGVAHGDLRRKNLLMGPAGEAYLIDFATAVRLRKGDGAWRRFLFKHARRIDRVTFARIKESYDPANLTAEERAWLAAEPWYLRLGRFLKQRVYVLRKGRFWRDRGRQVKRWWRGRK